MELDEVKAETARLSNWAHIATVGADGNPEIGERAPEFVLPDATGGKVAVRCP